MKTSPDLRKIINQIIKFRDDRDWEQFHNLKDLSIGLSIEAAELMELFLWKTPEETEKFVHNTDNKIKVEEELADVFIYCLLIINKLDSDLEKIICSKLKKNADKYPVAKSRGTAKKYNELNS